MCFLFSGAISVYIKRTWSLENKDIYTKLNEIVTCILCAFIGVLYHYFVLKFGDSFPGNAYSSLRLELALVGATGILSVMLIMGIWAISHKFTTLKHPELLEGENNYELFCERFMKNYRPSIKRKITHLLPLGVVASIVVIFYFLSLNPIYKMENIWRNFSLFFVVVIGIDFAYTFLLGDLIRLLDYSYMPRVVGKLFAIGLNPEELDTFSSTSIMVFGFAPFLLLQFPLFFIILLVTSVADGMASIFGLLAEKKGKKHRFPKKGHKSIEGYIGGSLFAFLSTIFGGFFSNLFGFSDPSIWTIHLFLSLGLILAIVIFIIDVITSNKINICDNYLNPLACGIAAMAFLTIIGVSF
ncbi:MAG: hypothetical protein ACFFAS_18785 [Promethearchaeota archaeon]